MYSTTTLLLLIFSSHLLGQSPHTNRKITIHKTSAMIIVDGKLDEQEWRDAVKADSFINKWPIDSGSARLQTEVKITYNEQYIFFGVKAFLSDKAPVIQSLKRDVNPYYSDGVSIVLDPAGKSTSGYTFGVNAAGAQMEGIAEGNSTSFDWDTKWFSQTKLFNNYWVAELAIPFKAIRFSKDIDHWGINFIRNDMTNNSFSTWNQVPIQFFGANLGFLGKVYFGDRLPTVKANNSFIPYVTVKANEVNHAYQTKMDVGLDAKIAVNSSLNLDLTVNPDFSQVDVDRQIINLDRFDVLLPERRAFFLENSDLFQNMGIPDLATPFISRRIGLTPDGRVVPIIAGARLTGNLNPGLRVGLMNIETAKKYRAPAENYMVAAVDLKIFKASNWRAIITNRQSTGMQNGENVKPITNDYNRVAGTEFNFITNNTRWNARVGYYHSFNPAKKDSSGFAMLNVGYMDQRFSIRAGWHQVQSNYISDVGFTPRLYNYDALRDSTIRIGYNAFSGSSHFLLYPNSKKTFNTLDFSLQTNHYFTSTGKFTEFNAMAGINLLFANRREASVSWSQNAVQLLFPTLLFSKTGILPATRYNFGYLQLRFSSNFLRPFSWSLTTEHGQYYNGHRSTAIGSIKYRAKTWGNFGAEFIYNDLELNNTSIHPYLFGPTAEFALSTKTFFTTFLQYNTLSNNFNINSRFQWRFKPGSDLYIVYTDNYNTDGLQHKNRNLVVKMNYWIN